MKYIFLLILLLFAKCGIGDKNLEKTKVTISIDIDSSIYNKLSTDEVFYSIQKKLDKRFKIYGIKIEDFKKSNNENKASFTLIQHKDRAADITKIIEIQGKLDFKLVSEEATNELYNLIKNNKNRQIFNSDYKLMPEFKKILPENTESFVVVNNGLFELEKSIELLVVENISLLGESINIIPSSVSLTGKEKRYFLNYQLDKENAEIFSQVTAESINKQIAIIVDNKIIAAPIITDKIPNGKIQVSLPNVKKEDLFLLCMVLRTKPLDYPLKVISIEKINFE